MERSASVFMGRACILPAASARGARELNGEDFIGDPDQSSSKRRRAAA